ncbi:Hypothetical predicted protein [Paramuricea clavata]|uniref:Uncharacterized protein n=1 Tax=Paramuricea clavata TaxID=317549 RepID=A0A6S7H7T0_PARCT|nr:Hypothetical predicted protein [Paramuricea clavata]
MASTSEVTQNKAMNSIGKLEEFDETRWTGLHIEKELNRWTSECEQAFLKAKELIASEEVLAHYDPQRPIKLECAVSPYGLGTVLTQVMGDNTERPMAYASRSLTKTEKHSQIDKKALTLFDYEIEHRSSTQHCNADGLSRLPLATTEDEENQSVDPVEAFHVSQFSMLPVTWQQVRKATQRDSTLAQVYEHVMKGWHENKDPNLQPFYSRRNELTVHRVRMYYVGEQSCHSHKVTKRSTTSITRKSCWCETQHTAHSTTGETPATLFMGRNLRTLFIVDLIKPDIRKHVIEKQVSQAKPKGAIAGNVRQLFIGQAVSVRNYRGKEKWIQGIMRARTGPVSYQVEIAPNVIWRRHVDQLLASENINDTHSRSRTSYIYSRLGQ